MVRAAVVAFFFAPVVACGTSARDAPGSDADNAAHPSVGPAVCADEVVGSASADPTGEAAPDPTGEVPAKRVRLLEEAAAGLEVSARRLWPDSFAGLWIDDDTGTVKIAFTRDAGGKVEQLGRDSAHPEFLQAVTHERSLAELEELQQRMGDDRELARAGKFSLPGVPGHRYDLDIDVERNTVLVFLENPDAAAITAFCNRYGEAVIVEQGLAQPDDARVDVPTVASDDPNR